MYLATAPEEKIRYIEGGERAVTRFEEGVAGYESRAYRGLGVFSSMPVRRRAAARGASCES